MRIGVDAYLLHPGAGYRAAGVSVYTDRLLAALPDAVQCGELIAFVGPDVPGRLGVEVVRAPVPVHRPALRIAWEQLGLPIQARRRGIELLHGVVNVLPELYRGPSVVTVHDLSFLRFPQRLSRRRALYLRNAVSRSARRATRVIAVSASTARDLVELGGVAEERISVVYPGVDSSFHPSSDGSAERPREVFGGRPYILHVGTLEPRKNQDVLIRAFARLRRSRGIPHVLAIIGAQGWMYRPLFDLVSELGLSGDVRFLDYVDSSGLPLWYNGADLFAYPSAFEGFGLPVLEAMACGVPTVTSAASSLQELAGEACLTVEPGSEEALETAMARILDDEELRQRLRQAGLKRAMEFSWQRTAEGTVAVYRAALGAHSNV